MCKCPSKEQQQEATGTAHGDSMETGRDTAPQGSRLGRRNLPKATSASREVGDPPHRDWGGPLVSAGRPSERLERLQTPSQGAKHTGRRQRRRLEADVTWGRAHPEAQRKHTAASSLRSRARTKMQSRKEERGKQKDCPAEARHSLVRLTTTSQDGGREMKGPNKDRKTGVLSRSSCPPAGS